ncbi:hypothetical protein ABZP36_027877 [Zizania latifolia]
MAPPVASIDGAPKHYPGKMTVFVFLACLVASSGGLIFGFDIGISDQSPPSDRSDSTQSWFFKNTNLLIDLTPHC